MKPSKLIFKKAAVRILIFLFILVLISGLAVLLGFFYLQSSNFERRLSTLITGRLEASGGTAERRGR